MNQPILFRFSAGALSLALSLATAAVGAESPRPARAAGKSEAIDKAMGEMINRHEIAGAVTIVLDRDKVLALDTVGQADVAGGKPMQADSIFWIASMTKPVTGAAIMMLQDEGKLSVDDPVEKYLPELGHLKTADGKPAKLTLRHLLTHTSGLQEPTGEQSHNARTLADLIPHFAEKPLAFEPGSKWQYCQTGINSLGRIIEVVSGQSLPEFMQKRLFGPLGMKDTTFYLTEAQMPRLAKSYKKEGDKLEEAANYFLGGREPTSRDRYPAANGGLFSTAPDYGRFCQMVLNHGTLDGRQYIKPESVELMTTVQSGTVVTGFTPGNGWGLGWCVIRQPQGVTAMLSPGSHGHGGAYGTQAWIDPKQGLIFILMVQRSNFPNSDDSAVRKAFQHAAVEEFGRK